LGFHRRISIRDRGKLIHRHKKQNHSSFNYPIRHFFLDIVTLIWHLCEQWRNPTAAFLKEILMRLGSIQSLLRQRLSLLLCLTQALLMRAGIAVRAGIAHDGWMIRFAPLLALMIVAVPAQADSLIDNANGITLTESGAVQRFTGLVITNDGKVARLLQKGDKRPDRPDFRLDAKGKTILPGLIDGHGHVMGLGWQLLTLDLSGTKSLDEAKAKIAAYAAEFPNRKWIIGSGWNQEAWGLGRFPTAADLDAVVADRPVWLERVDGHAGWANSAAIKAAGITEKTVSPPGGRIEKAGLKPSGVFVDAASSLIDKAVPKPLARDRDLALAKAQEALLSLGITAIADMGTGVDDWLTYRRAGDAGALRLRIISYAKGVEPALAIAGSGPTPWLYSDKLRMVGIKLLADGALGSRGAWLKQDYADKTGQRGLMFYDPTKLGNVMSLAAFNDFQIAVHAIGDGANGEVLDAIDDLAQTYKGDRRWRIEHAQIVDPADIERFARNGTIASMQPVHQVSDRQMAEARLGTGRLSGAYAWNSILKAGGRLAFGSDVPVESPDPFAGLAAAITREDAKGEPLGGWQPQERITREQALAGFTTGAAFAGFAEGKIGRLAPGMLADFLILDRDPMFIPPAEIRGTKVEETWVGGRRAWIKGK
jgi:predicted amidohydrolase YtcJ